MTKAEHIKGTLWILPVVARRETTTQAEKDYLLEVYDYLEQEPCEDCISRTEVNKLIQSSHLNLGNLLDTEIMQARINALPPCIQPKTGHLILLDECSNSGYYCSECHKKVVKEGWSDTVKKINYCPNCGAKMESEDKE